MNDLITRNNQTDKDVVALDEMQQGQLVACTARYQVYDKQRAGRVIDELIAGHKDERINTKRAIVESSASATRVQNQCHKIITLCEHELRRNDLTEKERIQILKWAKQESDVSAKADRDNRGFIQRELRYSHRSNWFLIGGLFIVLVGGGMYLRKV